MLSIVKDQRVHSGVQAEVGYCLGTLNFMTSPDGETIQGGSLFKGDTID